MGEHGLGGKEGRPATPLKSWLGEILAALGSALELPSAQCVALPLQPGSSGPDESFPGQVRGIYPIGVKAETRGRNLCFFGG